MIDKKPLEKGKFKLTKMDSIIFKTITDRNEVERDLIEFYVQNGEDIVHCVAWDNIARILRKKLETQNISEIELKYFEKENRVTKKIDFSVIQFQV